MVVGDSIVYDPNTLDLKFDLVQSRDDAARQYPGHARRAST